MAKGRPLSAAHKAAISAGMKRYWATKNASGSGGGERTTQTDGGGRISRSEAALVMHGSGAAHLKAASAPVKRTANAPKAISSKPARKVSKTSSHIGTGKSISREAAAAIMFGSAGAAKKIAAAKRRKKR